MGKGDIKTRKGKISNGSTGVSRQKKKKTAPIIVEKPKKATVKKVVAKKEVVKKAAPKKAAPKKEAPKKK